MKQIVQAAEIWFQWTYLSSAPHEISWRLSVYYNTQYYSEVEKLANIVSFLANSKL